MAYEFLEMSLAITCLLWSTLVVRGELGYVMLVRFTGYAGTECKYSSAIVILLLH